MELLKILSEQGQLLPLVEKVGSQKHFPQEQKVHMHMYM